MLFSQILQCIPGTSALTKRVNRAIRMSTVSFLWIIILLPIHLVILHTAFIKTLLGNAANDLRSVDIRPVMNQYGTDEGFIVSTAKFVKREVEEALDNL